MTQTTQKIQGRFYPLTPSYTQSLRQAKLTAAQWRIWSYLISFDPWGDKYQELPNTLTILSECDVKKSTFYTAIAKFQDLGLFDFQDRGFKFRNLAGIDKITNFQNFGKQSEESENVPKTRNEFQPTFRTSKCSIKEISKRCLYY